MELEIKSDLPSRKWRITQLVIEEGKHKNNNLNNIKPGPAAPPARHAADDRHREDRKHIVLRMYCAASLSSRLPGTGSDQIWSPRSAEKIGNENGQSIGFAVQTKPDTESDPLR